MNIKFTQQAIDFLKKNINLSSNENVLYISISYPFTKYAHINMNLFKLKDMKSSDIKLNLKEIDIYTNEKYINLLNDSEIDFNEELQINAPNLFLTEKINKQDIKSEIEYLFENEINIILAQHGGSIELLDINTDTITVKFNGGCQGCGMVGLTLNNYIEKIIKKNFPSIKNIIDNTSHEVKDNAYY
jgi:Fe/S biogenesis protein NfuA